MVSTGIGIGMRIIDTHCHLDVEEFDSDRDQVIENCLKAGVDKIAGYLKELQDAEIPVLWRPYHEMNGDWFWWGKKKGEDGYKKLWSMMYDRFVNFHGLNNLLWVFNTNEFKKIM